jgi:hypothetical protein
MLRVDDVTSSRLVAMFILLGVGALSLRWCAVHRVLTWIAFSLLVLSPVLRAYGGGRV